MRDKTEAIVDNLLAASPLNRSNKLELPSAYKPKKSHHGQRTSVVVRKAEHKGHKIVIRTTYRVEIDGKPLGVPIHVSDDGKVSCHSLPNYSVRSAVELVRTMIDVAATTAIPADEIGGHGSHGHAGRASSDRRS